VCNLIDTFLNVKSISLKATRTRRLNTIGTHLQTRNCRNRSIKKFTCWASKARLFARQTSADLAVPPTKNGKLTNAFEQVGMYILSTGFSIAFALSSKENALLKAKIISSSGLEILI